MPKSGSSSSYLPVPLLIERMARLTEKERLFKLSANGRKFSFEPGQFFMVGLPGYGEAPFSIASGAGLNPFKGKAAEADGSFELCIKAVGNLTNAIHRLKKGDTLWVRGPFGRGFDVNGMKGRDILFIAGGIGVVPMRGLIKTILGDRESFGRLTLVYGSKDPEGILFAGEMEDWKASGMAILLTVDKPAPGLSPFKGWKGHVGVVTTVIPGLDLDPSKTVAVIIGPPVMYRFVIKSLWDKNIAQGDIYLSLERRMKCGVGKCGHCQIGAIYACQEGPVFKLSELKDMPDAL